MRGTRVITALVLAAVVGCSGFNIRSGQPGQTYPGTDPNGPALPNPVNDPGSGPPGTNGGARPVPSSLPEVGAQRTVCRSSGRPRGWLAVDYVAGGVNCGASADDPYPAMVIQDLSPLPEGTVLAVCAGQPVPGNWAREPEDASRAAASQCPRRPGDKTTGPTVTFIRRIS
jgi:hypothetical protein